MTKCRSERSRYLVGIEYDCPYDHQGYFDLEITATLTEVAHEVLNIELHGHNFPTFPALANPTVLFACDLNNPDNGDCYAELVKSIELLRKRKGVAT